jgi:GntR family transcriptional regulator, transcriptional repressor for pyruvate dehydrogenase complex
MDVPELRTGAEAPEGSHDEHRRLDAALTFERAPRRKLAETVAARLLDAVRTQPPGTRMPTERALAEQLGVGRSTVREALNGLAALGILDIRHGQGVFVASSASARLGHEAVVPALIRAQTIALIEARLVVQPEIARLAAERRTAADLRALERVLEGQQRLAEGGPADRATKLGVEFDVRLAEAAKNEVLTGMVRSLFHQMLERAPRLHELSEGFGKWDVEEHRGIYLAVLDADAELAATCMRDHVVALRSLYEGLDAG